MRVIAALNFFEISHENWAVFLKPTLKISQSVGAALVTPAYCSFSPGPLLTASHESRCGKFDEAEQLARPYHL